MIFWLLTLVLSAPPAPFDRLQRLELAGLVHTPSFKAVDKVSELDLAGNDRQLAPGGAAFVVAKTRGGRYAKIRLIPGRLKSASGNLEPMILVEQFVTFKDGDLKAFVANGENRAIFPGTEFDLDLGQVVPERIGGDIRCASKEGNLALEVCPGAKLWLAIGNVPLPPNPDPGVPNGNDKFQASWFRGTYRLHDDGRRSGELSLLVMDDGEIKGKYFSDKDGASYEVQGRVGPQLHQIQFGIRFPRTEQIYQGFLFTGDGDAIAGTSKIGDRETGFYAKRVIR